MTKFEAKRIYEDLSNDDGYRVLVDRLWPRGISKEKANLDEWCKEVAPSNELRTWFSHDPDKFLEFKKKYLEELKSNKDLKEILSRWNKKDKVILLYGARDKDCNQAVVLLEYIKQIV